MAYTTSDYKKAETNLLQAVSNVLNSIDTKLSASSVVTKTFDDSTKVLTLENNTVHVYKGARGVSELTITYPSESLMSTVLFSTAQSGNIKITFKQGTKFIGSAPYEFFPGEDWELNIYNGVVVGSTIT